MTSSQVLEPDVMTSSIVTVAAAECAPPAPCTAVSKQFHNPLYAAEDDFDDYARIAVSSDTDQSQRDSRPASLDVTNAATPRRKQDPLSPTGYQQPPTPDFPPPSPATAEAGIEKKIAPIIEFVSRVSSLARVRFSCINFCIEMHESIVELSFFLL